MTKDSISLEYVIDLARKLTPLEKVRLIEEVAPDLEGPLGSAAQVSPLGGTLGDLVDSSLCGIWEDRTDIGDSVEFARQLRVKAEQRNHA